MLRDLSGCPNFPCTENHSFDQSRLASNLAPGQVNPTFIRLADGVHLTKGSVTSVRESNSRKSYVDWRWLLSMSPLVAALSACMGYTPGRLEYWDEVIREHCKKDGGVTIYDRIRVSKAEIDRHVLTITEGRYLGVTLKELAHPDSPAYAERRITYLREANPQVGRVEWIVIRRSDQAVVARWVSYGRFGGDAPGPSHESHFTCPDPQALRSDLQRLFIVEGNDK